MFLKALKLDEKLLSVKHFCNIFAIFAKSFTNC